MHCCQGFICESFHLLIIYFHIKHVQCSYFEKLFVLLKSLHDVVQSNSIHTQEKQLAYLGRKCPLNSWQHNHGKIEFSTLATEGLTMCVKTWNVTVYY